MEHSGFPSDETLAAFIDGRLDDVTRRRVVEHMTTCDECYAVYLAATEMQKASGPLPPRHRAVNRRFRAAMLAISAVLAMVVLVQLTPLHRYFGPRQSGIDSLVKASGDLPYRTVEGRLAGGFGWKPLHEIPRAATPVNVQRDPQKWSLLEASVDVAKTAERDRSPENLHALGVSHLLLGNFDEAIATLQAAERMRPRDAAIHNDLATAYLARAAYSDRAPDYVSAVEESKRAWELKQTPEIAWTRAMALEHLPMKTTARAAWNDYLALDPNSPWRAEAEQHVHDLSAPSDADLWKDIRPRLEHAAMNGDVREVRRIAAQFPSLVSGAGEEMLSRWGTTGDLKAFDAGEVISNVVAPRGYGYLQAICRAIRRASPERVDMTRRAMRQLEAGRKLLAERRYAEANEELVKSRELAQRAGSPLAQLVQLQIAVCSFNTNDYDRTMEDLDVLQRELARAPWSSLDKILRTRMAWVRGLTQVETGHPHDALRSYESALVLAQELGHLDWQAGLNALIAQNYELFGQTDKACEHRRTAFALSSRSGSAQRQEYILSEAATAAVMYDRPELGDIFTRSWLDAARALQSNDAIATAHIWRARYLAASGGADAVGELRRARIAALSISDGDARDRAIANLEMAEGALLAHAEPRTAVLRLTDSLHFLDENGNHLLRAEVFASRARAYETIHDARSAAADRAHGIAELETQGGRISDEKLRTAFVTVARQLYTDAVDLAVTSGDYAKAFDLTERSRATSAGVAPAMSIERLRQVLPEGVALVEYAALPGRSVAWIVRREGVTATILPSDGEAISASAERMIAQRTELRSFGVAAADLYARIIAPLRPRIASARVVVFVADPTWSRFPFAALFDPATGRFLCEDLDVATAPSASRFTHALLAAGRPRVPERVLVCADPDAGDAPRLIAARREGDLIGRTFAGAAVVSGNAATREDFVAKAPFATLIHFAGHARSDTRNDDYSALLFSGDGRSGSGALYAWEVRKLDLSHTRLVVLSACDTDAISDAFLAAGAPATIATLWDIGDGHSRALMSLMYRRLHDGDSPSHALRAAQLAVLHDPGSRPVDWAGFELVGL